MIRKVYIAGKYSAETKKGREENTKKAMEMWWELIDLGFVPFCPHLTHFLTDDNPSFGQKRNGSQEFWYDYDNEWLIHCDALLAISLSKGVYQEIELANKIGIEVFYSVEELMAYVQHEKDRGIQKQID